MATLEVHDDRGHVRRVEIDHDQPVLFGSSPKCDVVLEGDGVLPFHGRIRWKTKRFKADASPDARYLLINGHKMTASSFRQGDEIRVGPCRIFMIYADDELPRQDDKTRVQEPPIRVPDAPAAAEPPGAGRLARGPGDPPRLGRDRPRRAGREPVRRSSANARPTASPDPRGRNARERRAASHDSGPC